MSIATPGRIADRGTPRVRRAVHGVLLLDKPSGITSNAALGRARRALQAAKAGHTGTLDPLASGLLPLCFGEATKFASDLLDADKTYAATARLGITTTTGDAEGETVEVRTVDAASVTRARVESVLASLRGTIDQVPPMHSALKRDGRPLYELARRGITVDRAPRTVTIHRLVVDALDAETLAFEVTCSKGTYVRTLAEDIGRALGCGAHLIALRRTAVGSLSIDASHRLDAFEDLDEADRARCLRPVDALIERLPRVDLAPAEARRFVEGRRQRIASTLPAESRVRVYRHDDASSSATLIGTGSIGVDAWLAPVRVVAATTNVLT